MSRQPADPAWLDATTSHLEMIARYYWTVRSETENGTGGFTTPDRDLLATKLETVVEIAGWIVGSGTSILEPQFDQWYTDHGRNDDEFAECVSECMTMEFATRIGWTIDPTQCHWWKP